MDIPFSWKKMPFCIRDSSDYDLEHNRKMYTCLCSTTRKCILFV